MLFRLFLLFTIIPVVELALLIKIGTIIGTMNTVVLVIATALLGAYLVRIEGIGVINRFQSNLTEGVFPAEEIIDGAMILIAGALLVTPGVLTDVVGFLLVFPISRRFIKRFLRVYIEKKISDKNIRIHKL